MNGFVVIDKEPDMTSFFAASRLRKIYSEKKTGHTGTLDPMATGVLPVALGRATRFIDYLPDSTKGYTASFRLGITTDTLDITGTVLSETSFEISEETVKQAVNSFVGEIEQLPPMYSAISVNGQRLYKLARQGIEVARETRKVNIISIDYNGCDNGEYSISVVCSKGTYIRSLISDIGEKLGCGATMTYLRRTLACGFSISQANTLDIIRENPDEAIIRLDEALSCYPDVQISEAQTKRFSNGGDLLCERIHGFNPIAGLYRVYSNDRQFLGLGIIRDDDTTSLYAEKVMGNV